MQGFFSWTKIGLAILAAGGVSFRGCPAEMPSSDARMADERALPVAQAESTAAAIADYPPQVVAYELCGELPDWERLDLEAQTAALMENPRYGEALATDPLKSLFDKFWQESLITFTTYGLSARTEPINLSGVWTGIDAMDNCYEGDRPTAINAGELAEMWLIGYRIVDFVWTGETYQLTVEPTSTGLRFVQFERLEDAEQLPILVQEVDGDELTLASGDWVDE